MPRHGRIPRNSPCPCGSGKKHKKCHGLRVAPKPPFVLNNPPPEVRQKLEELQALEKQREKQQGYSRPIISATHKGYRVVAVGDRLHWSKSWKTFHDFLMYYLKHVLGGTWGTTELKKPFNERHPLLQWYELACREQQRAIQTPGKVYSAPMTGAIISYLTLAYNLYLIDHNMPSCPIRRRLIARLKNPQQFPGAVYETYVAATFVKAGFDIDFEDEEDSSTSHCEFVARSRASGIQYSVEAKTRQPGKGHYGVGKQLHSALRKKAAHTRIVFIDINVPEGVDGAEEMTWFDEAQKTLRDREAKLGSQTPPTPPAYVVVTNHPYQYNLAGTTLRASVLIEGFRIADFKLDSIPNLRAALETREKHGDMLGLIDSLREHYRIPATFSGEIPEFAFEPSPIPLLRVGKRYLVPCADGQEREAELLDASVLENDRTIYGLCRLDDGTGVLVTWNMTEKEWSAYRQHPDTFFGVYRPQRSASTALDLYDFFHDGYRNASKEQLLGLMEGHWDLQTLKALSREELLKVFCERLACTAWTQAARDKGRADPTLGS